MRVFLIVLLVLVLLIALICWSSGVVEFSYWDKELSWCVKYFGIKLLPRGRKDDAAEEDESASDDKKKDKKKKKDEASEEAKDGETPRQKTFLMDKLWRKMMDIVGKLDLAGSGIAALPGPFQKLLRSITWSDIETDILVAGDDAAKTARTFGTLQTAFRLLLCEAQQVIYVKAKRICIACDFIEDESRWNVRFKLKVRVGTVLAAGIWLAWRFVMDSITAKKQLVREKL